MYIKVSRQQERWKVGSKMISMDDLLLLLLLLLGERKKGVNPKRETGSLAQKTPSLLNPLFPSLSVNCKTEKPRVFNGSLRPWSAH